MSVIGHPTITFPIKSLADAKALAEELPALMPDFAKAQDTIGSAHSSRFWALVDKVFHWKVSNQLPANPVQKNINSRGC